MTAINDMGFLFERAGGTLEVGPYRLFYIPECDSDDTWGYYITDSRNGANLFRSKIYLVSALMRMVKLCEGLDNNINQ